MNCLNSVGVLFRITIWRPLMQPQSSIWRIVASADFLSLRLNKTK